jgi:Fur family transcriptional regulator, ferric uptake regulator
MKENHGNEITLDRIRARGLRITTPRKVILTELNASPQFVSAEEIYLNIHKKHPKIGLATVYRTLTLLAQIGIVTKFEFGDGKARYELADIDTESKHHHVLVCEKCYAVTKYSDFSVKEKKNFDQLESTLAERFNFSIQRHVVHYYGLCLSCSSE